MYNIVGCQCHLLCVIFQHNTTLNLAKSHAFTVSLYQICNTFCTGSVTTYVNNIIHHFIGNKYKI